MTTTQRCVQCKWIGNVTKHFCLHVRVAVVNLMLSGHCGLCCFLCQHVNEFSEGLLWASGEGCLEDVVFLLSTEVEVNSRDQVRLCYVNPWV